MRRAARTDANQKAIVAALRKAGFSVAITSQLGNGFPDLVVSGRHWARGGTWTMLMEVKDGSKAPSERRLTAAEMRFAADWQGEYTIVESPEEALDIMLGRKAPRYL